MNLSEIFALGGIIMTTFVLWLGREKIKLTARANLFVEELGPKPGNITLMWDIVNMSKFGVYIKSVGFACHSKFSLQSLCGCNVRYEVPSAYLKLSGINKGIPMFPMKLDAQEAITITLKEASQIEQLKDYKYLYVQTNSSYIKTAAVPIKELKLSAA